MLTDIQEAIESLEAHIEAEEKQIQLMKNDLKILKEKLSQQTKITNSNALPKSLDELFTQFYIRSDSGGIAKRTKHALERAGLTIEDLRNITFRELFSVRKFSKRTIAVIIVLLEHYGIEIEVTNSSASAKHIEDYFVPLYRKFIIFI